MISKSIPGLLERLNNYSQRVLENAVGACVTVGHYEVTISHLLSQCLEGEGDLACILSYFKLDLHPFQTAVQSDLKELKTGNNNKPVFSPHLLNILEAAWGECSLNLGIGEVRTGGVVLALCRNAGYLSPQMQIQFGKIPPDIVLSNFLKITQVSKENIPDSSHIKSAGSKSVKEGSFLDRFTVDFVEMARQGKIDPIFGRDREISQSIDILSRRRKNNPIFIGEAGVGKTAIVEGLALRIAQGEVPGFLKEASIRSLDMGLLSAGAGVRGEFENRLKGVIKEVKNSKGAVVLFIDEAHTIIGAGGEAGGNDAANLLKPELARGDLKVLAATTFGEFRKYMEKDPAIARRFQAVVIEEPDAAGAAVMLRGLQSKYEKFHGVKISHESIMAACELSDKFIAGRQLPDKAVDLLDTAAARVRMSLDIKPQQLQSLEQEAVNLKIQIKGLENDAADGLSLDKKILERAAARLGEVVSQIKTMEAQWSRESLAVKDILTLQKDLASCRGRESGSPGIQDALISSITSKTSELKAIQGDVPLIHAHVNKEVIAGIISEWTGIPAGNMVKDEAGILLKLESLINERVVGQPWGVAELANTLRAAKTGLTSPEAPLGVFLVTGPSGVGKTEVARVIADLLFGGERSVTTINMSEYQDSISVTQLKGASAGYVGYGDGGVLTEGVRKRPYSVVILDEVEKAHMDVLNMFYQVFDKGILRDGEGRDISFRNTVIIMTSNLGLETITAMAADSPNQYDYNQCINAILPELTAHFKPALLARAKVVAFMPLGVEALTQIAALKLKKTGERLMKHHSLAFAVSSGVVEGLVNGCVNGQSGARNIDSLLDQKFLPGVSRQLLLQVAEGKCFTHLFVDVNAQGEYNFNFSQDDFYAGGLEVNPHNI